MEQVAKARERSLLKEVNPGGAPMCPLMHEGSGIVGTVGLGGLQSTNSF